MNPVMKKNNQIICKKMSWIIAVLLVCNVAVIAGQSPCESGGHVVISDQRRSIFYSPSPTDSLLCDWYEMRPKIQGDVHWYRFLDRDADGMMPERCIQRNRCGTQVPIWMNGLHPMNYNVPVSRRVCAQFNPSSCCSWNTTIEVMRCNRIASRMPSRGNASADSFYVYHLPQPIGCPMAYCMWSDRPCKIGSIYNPNTGSCTGRHPVFSNVTLTGPSVVNNHIEFVCHFTPSRSFNFDDGSRYEVRFYFNGQLHPNATSLLQGRPHRAILQERYLRFNIGKQISCSVSAYWEGYKEYKSIQTHSNNSYFAGVLVLPSEISLSERDERPVAIEMISTLPILCKRPAEYGRCELTVRVLTPERVVANMQTTASGPQKLCTYRIGQDTSLNGGGIEEIDLESYEYSAETDEDAPLHRELIRERGDSVELFVKRGASVNGAADTEIHFEQFPMSVADHVEYPSGSEMVHSIWDNYQIPRVKVSLQPDGLMATCQATSDPRMITWDGSDYTILSRIGEFILWKSSTARAFEVHVRNWLCQENWLTSCVCGIAVHEGDTVLIVDLCGSREKNVPRVKITRLTKQGHEPNPAAMVTRDGAGNTFLVTMPSGARVQVDAHHWGMNVHAMAPAEDFGQVSGLCGTFDGNPDNDFMTQDTERVERREVFVDSWRIEIGTSLFDRPPTDFRGNAMYDESEVIQFCGCSASGSMTCGDNDRVEPDLGVGQPDMNLEEMISHQVLEESPTFLPAETRRRRRRRSLAEPEFSDMTYSDYIDDEPKYNYNYDQNVMPMFPVNWPTLTGITEQQAQEACSTALRYSSVYDICSLVDGLNVLDPMDRCVDDIRLMSDLLWAENSVREIEYRCLTTVMQRSDSNSTNADDVARHLCPNHCSGMGACINATCFCIQGQVGADCSLEEGVIPVIEYISNEGLCDINLRPCRLARLVVSNVLDSTNLTCKIEQVQINNNMHIYTDEFVYVNGTMNTNAEVTCGLPPSPVRFGSPTSNPDGKTHHAMSISLSNDGVIYSPPKLLTIYDSVCLQCSGHSECWPKNGACEIRGHCFEDGEADPDNWCHVCNPTADLFQFTLRDDHTAPVITNNNRIKRLANERLEMQLSVNDEHGRPVKFTLVNTNAHDLTLSNNGTLIWGGRRLKDDVSSIGVVEILEVKVTDECGNENSQILELEIIQCDCNGHGSCLPLNGSSKGYGLYKCLCDPLFTGVSCDIQVDPCEETSCVGGKCVVVDQYKLTTRCECFQGYGGDLCDVQLFFPPGNHGVWGPYGNYSKCTMPCDYGFQVQQRVCEVLPCIGPASQMRLCNTHACPVNTDHEPHAIVLGIQEFTILEMRDKERTFLETIATAVNQHCRMNVEKCCQMSDTKARSVPSEFVRIDNFEFPPGYPQVNGETNNQMWKLIGKMNTMYLRHICSYKSGVDINVIENELELDMYIDSDVLLEAVEQKRELFNEIFHFKMDVFPPGTDFLKEKAPFMNTEKPQQEPVYQKKSLILLYVFVAVAALSIVIFIVVASIIYSRKCSSAPTSRISHQNSLSRHPICKHEVETHRTSICEEPWEKPCEEPCGEEGQQNPGGQEEEDNLKNEEIAVNDV